MPLTTTPPSGVRSPFVARSRRGDTGGLGAALRRLAPPPPGTGPGAPARPEWAPDSVEVHPRCLRVGDDWQTTLVVADYPGEVHAGWLEALTSYPGRLDVSMHCEPVPPAVAAEQLRKRRARLESGRRHDADRGRLDDPALDAAADDAAALAQAVARGEGKLFSVSLYLTLHAPTREQLEDEVAAVRGILDSLLMRAHPATYRSLAAWTASLPLGLDALGARRTMDTAVLAAAFPFAARELTPPDPGLPAQASSGIFLGLAGAGAAMWDRWVQDNHNTVVFGRSGAGKSYLVKLDLLRSLYTGVEAHVIDPDEEYVRLAHAVGGSVVHLGGHDVHLNPFDPPNPRQRRRGEPPAVALTRRALFVHTLIATLLGGLDAAERAVLDTAIIRTYQQAGITTDPATWRRTPPLLADLAAVLTGLAATSKTTGDDTPTSSTGGVAAALADRLAPYTTGSHSGLFSAPTSHRLDHHLVVYTLRDLPDELRPAATLLALDTIWRQVTHPHRRRRLVVVDEAWQLLAEPEGARWLMRLAKSARKYWAGLTIVTQDVADALSSDLGRAVVANAACQILLRQAPQTIEQVTDAFHLSSGERAFLLAAGRGEGLLTAGTQRVAFTALASPTEDDLITTDPRYLATADTAPDTPDEADDDPDAWRSASAWEGDTAAVHDTRLDPQAVDNDGDTATAAGPTDAPPGSRSGDADGWWGSGSDPGASDIFWDEP